MRSITDPASLIIATPPRWSHALVTTSNVVSCILYICVCWRPTTCAFIDWTLVCNVPRRVSWWSWLFPRDGRAQNISWCSILPLLGYSCWLIELLVLSLVVGIFSGCGCYRTDRLYVYRMPYHCSITGWGACIKWALLVMVWQILLQIISFFYQLSSVRQI